MTYTKLAVGFIVRLREHRNERGSLIGGPFLHVGRVDHPGVRRLLAGGGWSIGLRRRSGPDGPSWYGVVFKYRGWRQA